jgi:hypothetical protein
MIVPALSSTFSKSARVMVCMILMSNHKNYRLYCVVSSSALNLPVLMPCRIVDCIFVSWFVIILPSHSFINSWIIASVDHHLDDTFCMSWSCVMAYLSRYFHTP